MARTGGAEQAPRAEEGHPGSSAWCSTPSPSRPSPRRCAIRATSTWNWSTPTCAQRAGLSRRLHPLAGAVAQAAGRPLGRPGAVGGAAYHRRPRTGDRAVQDPGILDHRGRRHRRLRSLPGARGRHDGKRLDEVRPRRRGDRPGRPRRGARRDLQGRLGREETGPAHACPALHHLDPAAGGLAQARLLGSAHLAGGAKAVRGTSASAARPSASSPICGPTACSPRPRPSPRQQGVIAGRYGKEPFPKAPASTRPRPRTPRKRPRGDPPDERLPQPGLPAPRCGSRPALRAHLEADDRLPDGGRAHRAHHRRTGQRRRQDRPARHRPESVLFDSYLAVYEEGRDDKPAGSGDENDDSGRLPIIREGIDAKVCSEARADQRAMNRRRAVPKPAWSRSWKSSASAGPPPTPRSSPPCATATTSRMDKNTSCRRTRPPGHRLPGRVLPPLCRVRFHGGPGREARPGLGRRAELEGLPTRVLERLPRRGRRDRHAAHHPGARRPSTSRSARTSSRPRPTARTRAPAPAAPMAGCR